MVIKRMSSYASKFFPKEPTKPQVSTAIPGPKAAHILGKLNKHWDPRTAILVQDLTGSHGNYLKDADGNMYLDMYSQVIFYKNLASLTGNRTLDRINRRWV